jgi:hypothetical protein
MIRPGRARRTTPHLVLGADAIAASVEEKRRLRDQTGAAAVV